MLLVLEQHQITLMLMIFGRGLEARPNTSFHWMVIKQW